MAAAVTGATDAAAARVLVDAAQALVNMVTVLDPNHDTTLWDEIISVQQGIVNQLLADENSAETEAAKLAMATTKVNELKTVAAKDLTDEANLTAAEEAVAAATTALEGVAGSNPGKAVLTAQFEIDKGTVERARIVFAGPLNEAKIALSNKINNAQAAISGKTEGVAVGNQIIGSKDTLEAAITVAQNAYANTTFTAARLDEARVTLDEAITAYNNSTVTVLTLSDQSVIVGGHDFPNSNKITLTTGETLTAFSENKNIAKLRIGIDSGIVSVEGVAIGTATITVQVKKEGQIIKTGTFTVTVSAT